MAKIDLVDVNKTIQSRDSSLERTLSRTVSAIFGRSSEAENQPKRGGSFSLKEINLTIPNGRTMVILGPSGCGKTTLLRVIAGLLTPDSGQVFYDGVDLSGIPAKERGIGMVFQSYALYPHFSSKENILSYFLFREKTPELDQQAQEKFQRTSELMGVELEHLLGRMPGNLSGGERQRVALARCITRDPVVFLLDEPLSNLDQKLREKYRINLKKLLHHFRITTIYVTHDQHEAVILADEISIMDQGKIVQVDTYQQLYQSPNNIFVAEFLNLDYETRALNQCEGEVISAAYQGKLIGFRPEDAVIAGQEEGTFRARIVDVIALPLKNKSVLTVQLRGADFQLYSDQTHQEGEAVEIRLRRFHVFDPKTGDRIASPQITD
jgi:ABC-type sugar transport system ATPase subunit